MNIPPERTGQMNASVFEVMKEAGKALNDTFGTSVAASKGSGDCTEGVLEMILPANSQFDYVVSMEDLSMGQRIANYSIDFQRQGSTTWETLVPPVIKKKKQVGDRPDGHDPRDSYVGHKRIDFPIVKTSGPDAIDIARVRFNCIRALETPIHLRSFKLHKKTVPWEK